MRGLHMPAPPSTSAETRSVLLHLPFTWALTAQIHLRLLARITLLPPECLSSSPEVLSFLFAEDLFVQLPWVCRLHSFHVSRLTF